MIIKAFAKVNLLLNVLGIRSDGYHELETVMQTLALHDEIRLEPASEIHLEVVGAALPAGMENLAYRAAALLRRRTGYRSGVDIRLTKKIPLAAGLAGGSADAAAILCGLNEMWNLGLEMEDLIQLGAELGSDVPFCLRGGTALCRGRGELVTPLPALPAAGVLLVKPSFGVSTTDVYGQYDNTPAEPFHPDIRDMLAAVESGDLAGVAKNMGNSLEKVTLAMHPEIGLIKQEIASTGAMGVLMSGSGPTVFGLYADPLSAERAAVLMAKDDRWVQATTTQGPGLTPDPPPFLLNIT